MRERVWEAKTISCVPELQRSDFSWTNETNICTFSFELLSCWNFQVSEVKFVPARQPSVFQPIGTGILHKMAHISALLHFIEDPCRSPDMLPGL